MRNNVRFRYWLYAAIKFKCLIVTNDEMRDHTFQLLGNDFFPKWKERHQVSVVGFPINLDYWSFSLIKVTCLLTILSFPKSSDNL